MTNCSCSASTDLSGQRRALVIAQILNAVVFVVDFAGGILGKSSGPIADSLDMLPDASAYASALAAIDRSARFSGLLLLVLGVGVALDVNRRAVLGGEPRGPIMVGIA